MIPSSRRLYEENKAGTGEIELAKKYKTTRATIHGRIYRYKKENDLMNDDAVPESQTTIEMRDNSGVVTVSGKIGHIKTLDQLLKACDVDTDVWEVTRWIANKWDVTNSEGKRYQNFQVKAWLARLEPIDVFPDLQPVHIELYREKRKPSRKDGIKRVMVIADPHFGYSKDSGSLVPYHSEDVLSIALNIFEDNKFDTLIWAGDVLDCNEWSDKFIKRPEFVQTTQPALNEAALWMARFISVNPEAEFIMLEGNHDNRIERYIINSLSEAYQLKPGDLPDSEPVMSISNLLGLKRMGVNYQKEHIIGSTKFVHGDVVRKGGGLTAKATLENTITSVVFAHVHRRELVTETKIGERNKRVEVFSMCPGCACHIDGRVPGAEYDDNWQNGIGVIEFYDDECVSHQIIKIENGRGAYNGVIY